MTQKRGLRDVIAGETRLCFLDEKNVEFYYCGYSIKDLAEHSTFEEVAYLLLNGELPSANKLRHFSGELRREFADFHPNVVKALRLQPSLAHPMDLLSALVRVAGNYELSRSHFQGGEEDYARSKKLIAQMGHFSAIISRYLQGQLPVMPLGEGSLAKNILYSLTGHEPDELEARIMDLTMILYAEHEFNSSSWGGVRNSATAHSDIYSAIVNGIGNLRGARHGGANELAMYLLTELDASGVEDVEAEILRRVAAKETIPGFGHPVYTHGDPRVPIFKPWVAFLSGMKGDMRWYNLCEKIERAMLKAKEQNPEMKFWFPNIDFWIAPAYHLLGIPIPLYTPLFAAARISGWCAHYFESRHILKEKLIRPRAEYIGSAPRKYPKRK